MNGGDAAVRALADSGAKHAFGIPGIHNLPIFDALAKGGGFDLVSPRHEQGAAFMADGYSRASGLPGVCLLAAGPGALNAASAASTAYMDSQPMLILAGGVNTTDVGKGVLHGFDQVSVFRPITSERPGLSEEPRNHVFGLCDGDVDDIHPSALPRVLD